MMHPNRYRQVRGPSNRLSKRYVSALSAHSLFQKEIDNAIPACIS